MPGYRVRKRDDKYEVLYPSGKVRCRVDDGELAYEIAGGFSFGGEVYAWLQSKKT